MILSGTFTFEGPRTRVWDILQDPDVLAKALPGTKTLTKVGEDRYQGIMKVRWADERGRVNSRRVKDKVEPENFSMLSTARAAWYSESRRRSRREHPGGDGDEYTSTCRLEASIAASARCSSRRKMIRALGSIDRAEQRWIDERDEETSERRGSQGPRSGRLERARAPPTKNETLRSVFPSASLYELLPAAAHCCDAKPPPASKA